MEKRKSLLNVSISVSTKLFLMVFVIIVKRLLIDYCGNEMNGLNALYISIINFLSVVDLGVGSAISFCMYKPVVDGNTAQVSALYYLFRKAYLIIGSINFALGLAVMPFLPYLANDYSDININIYFTYFVMLISVVLVYLFSADISLINAYKNNYITTGINSLILFVQYMLQIVALVLTRSFVWYLAARIVATLLQWVLTRGVSCKKYPDVISNRQERIDGETKSRLVKSIKAMFMHKIGHALVNTVDSVVISAFVGVTALGGYSNYTMFTTSMVGVISLLFTSLTSVIGHLCVKQEPHEVERYCSSFHLMNFVVGTVFFLGYYAIADCLVALFFSAELVAERSVSAVITINGFIQFMRYGVMTFRDASGTFYNDRWKALFEGIANIILSVILVHFIGVVGVIAATVITNLFISHIVEPYVLYKHAFHVSVKKYYLKNYCLIAVFIGALCAMNTLLRDAAEPVSALLFNGTVSVCVSAVVCGVVLIFNLKTAKRMILFFKKQ